MKEEKIDCSAPQQATSHSSKGERNAGEGKLKHQYFLHLLDISKSGKLITYQALVESGATFIWKRIEEDSARACKYGCYFWASSSIQFGLRHGEFSDP